MKKRRTIVRVEATGKPLSMLNYVSDRITLQVNSSCLHFYELHQPVLQKYLGSLTYIFMNNMPIMSLDRVDVLKSCALLVYSCLNATVVSASGMNSSEGYRRASCYRYVGQS